MLAKYEIYMWLFLGIYLVANGIPRVAPWAGYLAGAFILILSIIKLVG